MTTYPKTIEETDMDTNNHEHKQHGDFAKVKPSRVARRPLAAGSTLYGFRRLALPGAEDAPVTDLQLRDETPDEASAERWFRTIYWPPGVNMRCPRCSWNEPSKSLRDKSALPYRCLRCRKTFSVKTNTVMHRSRLTLVQWKQALHIWTGGDRPCSSKELGSRIGVDDGTARDITQRLLKAAQEDIPPLREPSELARFRLGGKPKFRRKGRHLPSPVIVIAMVGRHSGRTIIRRVSKEDKATFQGFIGEHFTPGMHLYLSNHRIHQGIPNVIPHYLSHPESSYLLLNLKRTIRTTWDTVYRGIDERYAEGYLAGLQWWENHQNLSHRERAAQLALGMRWKEPPPSKTQRRRTRQQESAQSATVTDPSLGLAELWWDLT